MTSQNSKAQDGGRDEGATPGSDRNFGFVFAAFCALVATYLLWNGRSVFWVWTGATVVFLTLAVYAPRILHPLNIAWFKFGVLLHHILSPTILALMFVIVFVPIGLWMRVIGKRPLTLSIDRKNSGSYWILREPPGPPPKSFLDQF